MGPRNFCDEGLVCERRCGNVVPHKLLEPDRVAGQPLPPAHNTTLRMTHAEGRAWYSALMQARRYLEWGAGGTTILAAWRAIHPALPPLEAHTIESSQAFLDQLRDLQLVRTAEAQAAVSPRSTCGYANGIGCGTGSSGLTLHVGNLGTLALRGWGAPAKDWASRPVDMRIAQARSYVVRPSTDPAGMCCFDTILIDGRFRLACALQALRLSHAHTRVMVHDFHTLFQKRGGLLHRGRGADGKSRRGGSYANITLYYDALQRVDTLAVLRPKLAALTMAKQSDWRFEEALRSALDDPS